jgi:hypothetical protein
MTMMSRPRQSTARSILVRRNGHRADFPSEQVVGLSRGNETVPLDAKAGVMTPPAIIIPFSELF